MTFNRMDVVKNMSDVHSLKMRKKRIIPESKITRMVNEA